MLLDVDLDYGMSASEAERDARAAMKRRNVNWPCVLLKGGWNEARDKFKADGYQLIVVKPDGTTRSNGIFGDQLESHIKKGLAAS